MHGPKFHQDGNPFSDHMLMLFGKHAVVDLDLRCEVI